MKNQITETMNYLKSYKTTLAGLFAAFIYAFQSGAATCLINGAIDYNCLKALAFSAAIAAIGIAAKDADKTGIAKTIAFFFLLTFTATNAEAQTSSPVQRFSFLPISAPIGSKEGSLVFVREGLLVCDTAQTANDTAIVISKTNTDSKEVVNLAATASRATGASEAQLSALDSTATGGALDIISGFGGKALVGYSYGSNSGGHNNSIGADSNGIVIETWNTQTEHQENFTLSKVSPIQWNGQQTESGVITAGQISTTSGVDTIFLTHNGLENGRAIYSSVTEYNVILNSPSSDSTVYSFKVVKAAKYFVVTVRQSNTLFHFSLVANATKVDYLTAGN